MKTTVAENPAELTDPVAAPATPKQTLPDWIKHTPRWSRKLVWASVVFSLIVAVIGGVIDALVPPRHSQPRIVGSLYAKDFPFIDIAVDQESLARWNALGEIKDDQERLVQWATLAKEDKTFPVAPGTEVRVIQVVGGDCSVNITTGKEVGKTGWVGCWMVNRQ